MSTFIDILHIDLSCQDNNHYGVLQVPNKITELDEARQTSFAWRKPLSHADSTTGGGTSSLRGGGGCGGYIGGGPICTYQNCSYLWVDLDFC